METVGRVERGLPPFNQAGPLQVAWFQPNPLTSLRLLSWLWGHLAVLPVIRAAGSQSVCPVATAGVPVGWVSPWPGFSIHVLSSWVLGWSATEDQF